MLNKKIGLNQDEMQKAINLFIDTYSKVSQNNSQLPEIQKWIKETILGTVPCYMFRPDILKMVSDSVFKSELIRDFIFDLSFRFFSLLDNSDHYTEKLINNLCNGLMVDSEKLTLIPQSTRQSLVSTQIPEMFYITKVGFFGIKKKTLLSELLLSNKHLIVILFLHLTAT